MVSVDTSLFMRCLYGVWMVLAVFIWDSTVAIVVGTNGVKNKLGGGLYYIEKLSGLVLATFGVLLSFS